jgi:hypothetical protein
VDTSSIKSGRIPLNKMSVWIKEIDLRVSGGRVRLNDDLERVVIGQIFMKIGRVQLFYSGAETVDAKGEVSFRYP